MPKGTFDADFAAFDRAVETSTGKVIAFEAQTARLPAAVDKMGAAGAGFETVAQGADHVADSLTEVGKSAETAEQWLERSLASAAERKAQADATTGSLDRQAAALEENAAAAAKNSESLLNMATASAVVSTAMAAWDVGRAVAGFLDLDTKVANATAKLLGYGDAAEQVALNKQATLANATKLAGHEITDFTEAVKIQAAAYTEYNDALVRAQGPELGRKQMEGFRLELEKVQAAGVMEGLRKDIDSHNFSQQQLADHYRVSVAAIQLFSRDIKEAGDAAAKSAKAGEQAVKDYEAQQKKYGETIKEVQKIEAGKNEASSQGILGLSALEQKESQARFAADAKGLDQLEKAEKELRDYEMKAATDTATYQILKIWEHVKEQEKAYAGLEAKRGEYNFALESKAAQEADAISASMQVKTEVVGRAVITMAGAVGGAIDTMAGGVGGALDMMATKAESTLAQVQAKAQSVQQYSMVGGRQLSQRELDAYYQTPGGIGDIIRNNGKRYYEGEVLPRAAGGPVDAGRAYVVGERGPELFLPDRSGSIAPVGSGGLTVNVYVTQPLGTPDAIARAVGKAQLDVLRTQGVRLPMGA